MGLSIYYSGRLNKAESLPSLIEEVKDISKVYDWKYEIYKTNFPNDTFDNSTSFEPLYGLHFTPTNCETISLVFLSNGTMVCPSRVSFFADSKSETERAYIYTISVKTQFAGVLMHQLIIRLFKYLNEKYFRDFKLSDESQYWETDDENLMRKEFKSYDDLLDNFTLSIQTFPIKPDENMLSYFERLMEHVNKLEKD
jgi:hypothetical protein